MRANFTVEKLRCDIAEVLSKSDALDGELADWIAERVVAALRQKYGARNIYIPAAEKKPVAELLAAYHTGEKVRSICRRLNVSRSTLYKVLALEADLVSEGTNTAKLDKPPSRRA